MLAIGSRVMDQLQNLRTASTDNVQWTLSQLEVELLVYQRALDAAQADQVDADELQDVRQRFNILFSRVATIQSSEIYRDLRADPGISLVLEDFTAFLDRSVRFIDGDDALLEGQLLALSQLTQDMRSHARTIALKGIQISSTKALDQRSVLSTLLIQFSALTILTIVALGAALSFLFRQFSVAGRESRERHLTTERLASTVGASLDAVIVADANGDVIDFNGAAKKIFGFEQSEAIGRSLSDLIIPEKFREAHKAGMHRFLTTGEKRVIGQGLVQLEALHKDGHEFPVEVSIAQATGPNGPIFVSFIRDITDRIATQDKLTQALEDALAADKAKSSFLAVMSHEMRTPINGVMGTLDLLEASEMTNKQREYVELAKVSGNLLLRHVGDVLDISKAEAGKLELHTDVFQPEALIKEVLSTNLALAKSRSNQLECHVNLIPECWVAGDSFRLRQVLLNLVGNAIKFTSNGRIDVHVTKLPNAEDRYEFRVSDTGIAISKDQLERIFDDFVTLDTGYDRRNEGTGLGLGISRRMVEALGGEIGVTSVDGEGSSFWFQVPLVAAEEPEVSTERHKDLLTSQPRDQASLSILIVEDNKINRFVLKETLQGLGHTVADAHNGQEGMDKANSVRFDAIFMDVSMPVMDGVEATKRIRASDAASSKAPIIGLTAHAYAEEHDRFIAAGMNIVLTKPARLHQLEQALYDLCQPTLSAKPQTTNPVIDLEVVQQLKSLLGEEAYRKNLNRFFAEVEDVLGILSPVETEMELSALKDNIHTLAGSAAVFGAFQLQRFLARLERNIDHEGSAAPPEIAIEMSEIWRQTVVLYQEPQQ